MNASSRHLLDTAVILAKMQAPTAFDHRQAEMRGLVLCVDCGRELTDPQASQVCGACEVRAGDDPLAPTAAA